MGYFISDVATNGRPSVKKKKKRELSIHFLHINTLHMDQGFNHKKTNYKSLRVKKNIAKLFMVLAWGVSMQNTTQKP